MFAMHYADQSGELSIRSCIQLLYLPFLASYFIDTEIPLACSGSTWWRHQMRTFSASLNLCEGNPPVTGGFPSQRPVKRSSDVFFDPRLNKRLSKQSERQRLETPPRLVWRHCNELKITNAITGVYSMIRWWYEKLSFLFKIMCEISVIASPPTRLFVQYHFQANTKVLHYRHFVTGTQRRVVESRKGPVMRIVFLCHDAFMKCWPNNHDLLPGFESHLSGTPASHAQSQCYRKMLLNGYSTLH